jgi:N-methylhydantoinase A
MAGAIRQAAARHGDDLRDFVLVAGGGAGPLHAASVMRSLGMPAAIIPPHPGLLSALGLLGAHIRHDHVVPLLAIEGSMSQATIDEAFDELATQVRAALEDDGVPPQDHRFEHSLDIRYLGQDHALPVAAGAGEALPEVIARFHEQHARTFGHAAPEVTTEVVSARIAGVGLRTMPELAPALATDPGSAYATRPVTFDSAHGAVEAAIYRRAELAAGQEFAGPAIVEQLDTTTVIPPDCRVTVHPSGSLIVSP